MKANNNKIDVIGDVHGRCAELKALLAQLGYAPENGAWRHPERTALFIGDLVDRGPDVPGVLELVKGMADAGSARVLLGNHEFNLLCWYTPDGQGDYLRPRTDRNAEMIVQTRPFFDANPDAAALYLKWFRNLPIRLELGGARFVHAYWGPRELALLGNRNTLNECDWGDPLFRKHPLGLAVELLIKGPEVRLPEHCYTIDRQGSKRKKARIAWWKDGRARAMRDLIMPYTPTLPTDTLPDADLGVYEPYSADAPPVFIGHYGLKDNAGLLAPNLACVDYQGADGQWIGAYRWNGERELQASRFVLPEGKA